MICDDTQIRKICVYIVYVFVGVSNRPRKTQVAEQLLLVSQERLGQSFLEEHQSHAGAVMNCHWKRWGKNSGNGPV